MSNRIAEVRGLGFTSVGIYLLGLGLYYSPWFSGSSALFGTVQSLFVAITLLVTGLVSLLRGDRLVGAFFIFWSALASADPGMVSNVWANSGAFEGAENSRVWNGFILFGFALFNLPAGISALRGNEVDTAGGLAMVAAGVLFFVNAVEHWGTAYWGVHVLDAVVGGAGLVGATAAFWAGGRALLQKDKTTPG